MTKAGGDQLRWFILVAFATIVWAERGWAIPVFAKIYGQPCAACHTVFPQLNPAGENFRLRGLHGLQPVVKPLRFGPFEVPGTLPVALGMGFGEDLSKVSVPGKPEDLQEHFNLEFLSILAGGELGKHLAFLADYAPLLHDTRTGELNENTRPGLAFLQAHADRWGWVMNLRAGLFELPLGASPRVHRLSSQGYLTYGLTAFSLLGQRPPVDTVRKDTLVLASGQIGGELSGRYAASGLHLAAGVVNGSNNRKDNNSSKDVYTRIGQTVGFHNFGFLFYYSPDVLGLGARDWALRMGPDANLYFRRLTVLAQVISGYDSNPTDHQESLWFFGGFVEGDYRLTPRLVSLLRGEYAGTPTFDDQDSGGTTRVRKRLWQLTTGLQWLLLENVKILVEGTYGENHDAVSNRTTESYYVTFRAITAFWPLTPPGLELLRGGDR